MGNCREEFEETQNDTFNELIAIIGRLVNIIATLTKDQNKEKLERVPYIGDLLNTTCDCGRGHVYGDSPEDCTTASTDKHEVDLDKFNEALDMFYEKSKKIT